MLISYLARKHPGNKQHKYYLNNYLYLYQG